MTDEELIAQGWRKCAEGQRTTQFCSQVERWRKVAQQLADAITDAASVGDDGGDCWCPYPPSEDEEHDMDCVRFTRAMIAYLNALEGKP